MPSELYSKETVLKCAQQICDEINQQIPLAANRFEYFMQIHREATQKEEDQLNAEYAVFCQEWDESEVEYYINKHISTLFTQYVLRHKLSDKQWLAEDRKNFIEMCIDSVGTVYDEMKTIKAVLNETLDVSLDKLRNTLKNTIEQNIDLLQQDQPLIITNQELEKKHQLSERIAKEHELVKHRIILQEQMMTSLSSYINEQHGNLMDNDKLYSDLTKINEFLVGHYYDKTKCNSGYCGEHNSLALWKFYESKLLFNVKSIETIYIPWLYQGKEYNNHVFIAINRDPTSDLKDPSTWGDDAIFFDAWNNLVCYASQFKSLPYKYYAYPTDGKWSSLTYQDKDWSLAYNLTNMQKDYEITNNLDIETRSKIIMDEYQLTSIDTQEYQHTYKLLDMLITTNRPLNFHTPIDIYITTCSNKPITPITGLKNPAIAIHKDFFQLIKDGKASMSDLHLGIASTLHEIQSNGLTGHQYRPAVDQYLSIDRDLIVQSKNGDGLIHYLRLYHDFLKSHQEQNHTLEDNLLDYLDTETQQRVIEQRIKAIETLLAKEEHVSTQTNVQTLDSQVNKELADLQFKTYFKDGFDKQTSIEGKLHYLTACLPELKIELIPNELHKDRLSRRVREYIALLESIHVNFKKYTHASAANGLIEQAYQLRVPGFYQIYIALVKPHKNKYDLVDGIIPPLGPFIILNDLINKIADCKTYQEISTLSEQFVNLWDKEYRHHFHNHPASNAADEYSHNYHKIHNNYPSGDSRYFGSELGTHLAINDSLKYSASLLKYMKDNSDQNIAKLLYIFGNHSDEVLNTIDADVLFSLMRNYDGLQFGLFEFNWASIRNSFENICTRKKLTTDMFNTNISFKEKVMQFLEANADLLTTYEVNDGDKPASNFNGVATQYLLEHFTYIAQFGTTEEKQVIKDFFLKPLSSNSLYSIQKRVGRFVQSLPYSSLFIKFVIEGKYLSTKVNLFTVEEKLEFYRKSGVFHGECDLPALRYIDLFELKYETLSFDCLTEIIDQLVKYNITSYHPIMDLLDEHLKHTKSYTVSSSDTKKLASLLQKTRNYSPGSSPYDELLSRILWDLPVRESAISFSQLNDLSYLYRAYNSCAKFPSVNDQQDFQQLLIIGIKQTSPEQQMELLQSILFNHDFSEPITDYQFAKSIIDMFVNLAVKQYGYDDGSQQYFDKIKPMLENISKHSPSRDKETIFSGLLDQINAQKQVSLFPISNLHSDTSKTYKHYTDDKRDNNKISGLAAISLYFGSEENDQQAFIEFFSSPLTNESSNKFSLYLFNHPKRDGIIETMGYNTNDVSNNENYLRFYSLNLYQQFWDASLEERAVIFDHLLIPAQHTISDEEEIRAYQHALAFVGKRLFPNADNKKSDDHFAMAILDAYLKTSNKYQRSILLSGMLVASNKQDKSVTLSTGKKIAILCEHMGPAYVKLAQAIHSYPSTPASLRDDIAHVKGHANPPKRWELWRLIDLHVSEKDKANIKHVGRLLGSASYNLALEVTLQDGTEAVLILLRDHAAVDADKGFVHLTGTINECQHPRMTIIREPMFSILSEAKKQSIVEMDPIASQKQFALAQKNYRNDRHQLASQHYDFDIEPALYMSGGDGYRIISKLDGTEFNDLPSQTQDEIRLKKEVAKAVLTIELANIFSGKQFDSDRHGNQMRVKVDRRKVQLGLYDFGEMALQPPSEAEIELFCKALRDLPEALISLGSFDKAFESTLSKHINLEKSEENKRHLMRIRKAILALHDFQKELYSDELYSILKFISDSPLIHNKIHNAIKSVLNNIDYKYKLNYAANKFHGILNGLKFMFFGQAKHVASNSPDVSMDDQSSSKKRPYESEQDESHKIRKNEDVVMFEPSTCHL